MAPVKAAKAPNLRIPQDFLAPGEGAEDWGGGGGDWSLRRASAATIGSLGGAAAETVEELKGLPLLRFEK